MGTRPATGRCLHAGKRTDWTWGGWASPQIHGGSAPKPVATCWGGRMSGQSSGTNRSRYFRGSPMLAAAILFTTTPIQPINFDDFSLRRARTLDGQRLLVTSWLGNRPTPGMA